MVKKKKHTTFLETNTLRPSIPIFWKPETEHLTKIFKPFTLLPSSCTESTENTLIKFKCTATLDKWNGLIQTFTKTNVKIWRKWRLFCMFYDLNNGKSQCRCCLLLIKYLLLIKDVRYARYMYNLSSCWSRPDAMLFWFRVLSVVVGISPWARQLGLPGGENEVAFEQQDLWVVTEPILRWLNHLIYLRRRFIFRVWHLDERLWSQQKWREANWPMKELATAARYWLKSDLTQIFRAYRAMIKYVKYKFNKGISNDQR